MSKITNDGISNFDPGGNRSFWDWYGDGAPNTSDWRFLKAPLMSRYTCIGSGIEAFYIRTALAQTTADWVKLAFAGGTITGDLIVTGTITAGDFVASV